MTALLTPPRPHNSGPVVVVPRTATLGIYDSVEDYLRQERIREHNDRVLAERALKRRAFAGRRDDDAPGLIISGAAAGTWAFTNSTRTNLLNGTFDIDSDSWKLALFLSTSNIGASSTTYAGLTNEHANANGYTTGGEAITLTLSGTTTVTVDISVDPVFNASGGSIVARYAVIYEVGGNILCYALLDSAPADVTVADGNPLTVAASASGLFTIA